MVDTVADAQSLCQNCQRIRLDDSLVGGVVEQSHDGRHYLTFSDDRFIKEYYVASWRDSLPDLPNLLGSFIRTGCKMCRYLRQAIAQSNIRFSEPNIYIRLNYVWHFEGDFHDRERLRGLAATIHGDVDLNHLYFKVESDNSDVAHWLGIFGCPRPTVLCPETISWIKNELEQSQNELDTARDAEFIPARLLDVGASQTNEPRLVISSDIQEPMVEYAALSYCWGSRADALMQLKTESSSLASFRRMIPPSSLTSAMRDAMEVCQSLNIRFLWIDALCIVQDNQKDWEEQSAQMGNIFRNAHLTICALSSKSTHEGFLDRDQHILNFDFQSSLHPSISGKLRLNFRGAFNHYATLDEVYTELEGSRWSKRGWTFQEEQVSMRKLYFGRTISFIEFLNRHCREDGFAGKTYLASLYAMILDGRENPKDLPYNWQQELMINFTSRGFTFRDDKLSSISGLANEISKVTRDSYHAGIWEKHIPCGLLWNVEVDQNNPGFANLLKQLQSKPYIAPSWSFLSRSVYAREGVTFRGHPYRESHFRSELSSFHAMTTPKGFDPFGKIQSATLRVTAKLKRITQFTLLDQEQSNRSIIRAQTWMVDARNCFCQLDWFIPPGQMPTGDLSLLLLGSTCGEMEDLASSTTDRNSEVPFSSEGGSNIMSRNHDNMGQNACARCCSLNETATRPHVFCQACSHCTECCTMYKHVNRKAWGIIVHPAENPGTYYRVGVFVSDVAGRRSAGGTMIFNDAGHRTIDLI